MWSYQKCKNLESKDKSKNENSFISFTMAPLGNYSGLKPGFLKFKCHFFLPTESLSDKTNKSVNFPFSLMGLYFP